MEIVKGEELALQPQEKKTLQSLESLIENNLKSFFEVGLALKKIRDSKLYREEYPTFEMYCKERWEFRRAHAYRLIDSAQAVENVSHGRQKPTSERQARPLTKLSTPELQQEAWKKAIETAPEGKVTAYHVSRIVSKTIGEEVKKQVSKKRKEIDKEDLISDEFKEAFDRFVGAIQNARGRDWRTTSKEVVLQHIESLKNILLIGE